MIFNMVQLGGQALSRQLTRPIGGENPEAQHDPNELNPTTSSSILAFPPTNDSYMQKVAHKRNAAQNERTFR